MNQKQIDWVLDQLKNKGEVSRNQALREYISRLGALIHKLKRDYDLDFKAGYIKGDYVYQVKPIICGNCGEETDFRDAKFNSLDFWCSECYGAEESYLNI